MSAAYDPLDDETMAIKFLTSMILTEQEETTTPMAICQFPSFNSSDKKNTEAEEGGIPRKGEHVLTSNYTGRETNGLKVASIDNGQLRNLCHWRCRYK